jgi:hypothetical protein
VDRRDDDADQPPVLVVEDTAAWALALNSVSADGRLA